MMTFTKAQLASILATSVDFGIFWLLRHYTLIPVVPAGATSTLCGGLTHFTISRTWVFNAREGKWVAQLNRYVLVWIGNLVLNTAGLWLLSHYTGLKDMFAKVITSVVVAICYNYVLQKRFVFK